MHKTAVILDTEFTTWKGAMQNNWGEDWQHREIVQFGAIKIDVETFEILGRFDKLVKPAINTELSNFFEELTGITNADVQANGRDFAAVYQDFIDFADGDTVYCYGWDGKVIAENCTLIDRPAWRNDLEINSLHDYFEGHGVDTSKINSGRLARYFEIPLEVFEHNALDDVYSIHAALKHLHEKGAETPFDVNQIKKAS